MAGALAALLAIAAWRLVRSRIAAPAEMDLARAAASTAVTAARVVAPPAPVVPAATGASDAAAPAPKRPAPPLDAVDAEAELPHPHPITAAHERLRVENQLLGAMNDAMDLANGARLRSILNTYRAQFPEDPNFLQEGYGLIADCFEHPGAASSAAGQLYFDKERGSILRRMVERHCLGGP